MKGLRPWTPAELELQATLKRLEDELAEAKGKTEQSEKASKEAAEAAAEAAAAAAAAGLKAAEAGPFVVTRRPGFSSIAPRIRHTFGCAGQCVITRRAL
jgi:hypothetical protein